MRQFLARDRPETAERLETTSQLDEHMTDENIMPLQPNCKSLWRKLRNKKTAILRTAAEWNLSRLILFNEQKNSPSDPYRCCCRWRCVGGDPLYGCKTKSSARNAEQLF